MIALQEDILIGARSLKFHKVLNDTQAIGSPVNIIAKKDEFHWPAGGICVAAANELLELFQTTMNVGNCISNGPSGAAFDDRREEQLTSTG